MTTKRIQKAFISVDGTVAAYSEIDAQQLSHLILQGQQRFLGFFKVNGTLHSQRHLTPDISPSDYLSLKEIAQHLQPDLDGNAYEFFGEKISQKPSLRELTIGISRTGFYFQYVRKLFSPLSYLNRCEVFQFNLDRFGRFEKIEHYLLEENTKAESHKYTELNKLTYSKAAEAVSLGLELLTTSRSSDNPHSERTEDNLEH